MITLAELAGLFSEHREAYGLGVRPVELGSVRIGGDEPVLMGTLNLSRDSSYRESVATGTASALRKARVDMAQGAGVIDVGAESSNLGTRRVGPEEQLAQLAPVIGALASETVVSVETYHPDVVRGCLDAGARILNMTGRAQEDTMLTLAAEFGAAVVLCFSEVDNVREVADLPLDGDPIPHLLEHFGPRLDRARELGVTQVVIDPGMGFYYGNLVDPMPRARHQAIVLAQCFRLHELGVPVCNALPHAFDLFEEEFRTAESFFAVIAGLGGTHLFRTHEVARVRPVLRGLAELAVR